MVTFYSHPSFPFSNSKQFLEECNHLAELDFNMFSPVSKIWSFIRGGEIMSIFLEYRRPVAGC